MTAYRKPAAAAPARNRDRWATSYADFVTILLVLFIAIAAQGMQSAMVVAASAKAAAPVAAPSPPKPTDDPPPKPAYLSALEPLQKKGVKVRIEPRGVVISLEQGILFESGEDRINRSALGLIGEIAYVLQEIPNRVNLVGHADSRPIHSKRFRDNWELSVARSLRLRELLSDEFGIDEMRLSVASFGATEPVDSEDTEEGRANNRRVEFVILDPARSRNEARME
jgi:chemotaxis protein MotB